MLITIHIDTKSMKETKTFKLSEEKYECWILYHAFWLSCCVKIYRPIFETDRLVFTYFEKYDFEKTEKWLKEHGEQK